LAFDEIRFWGVSSPNDAFVFDTLLGNC
jgi:hypothetical protein